MPCSHISRPNGDRDRDKEKKERSSPPTSWRPSWPSRYKTVTKRSSAVPPPRETRLAILLARNSTTNHQAHTKQEYQLASLGNVIVHFSVSMTMRDVIGDVSSLDVCTWVP